MLYGEYMMLAMLLMIFLMNLENKTVYFKLFVITHRNIQRNIIIYYF